MASPTAKRYLFNFLLGAVWVAIPVFGVLRLYPAMARAASETTELERAQEALGRWLYKTDFPTETRIESERSFKKGLRAEYERVRNYYQSRDAMLERNLLDTYTGDPMQVKLKYQKLKQDLTARVRYESAKTILRKPFMPPYGWEEPGKTPSKDDFKMLEKKACIADALASLLTGVGSCCAGHIAIGTSVAPPAPKTEEEVAETEGAEEGISCQTWPVTVELVVPFRDLAAVLDKLLAPPPAHPCMVVRAVALDAATGGQVIAKLTLDVLDFE